MFYFGYVAFASLLFFNSSWWRFASCLIQVSTRFSPGCSCVDEKDSIQMIDFVLNGAREQAPALNSIFSPLAFVAWTSTDSGRVMSA